MARTTPYLLIVGLHRVFGVDRNIVFVIIGPPPSCFLMTQVTESFLLVSFVFLESDDRSSRIGG